MMLDGPMIIFTIFLVLVCAFCFWAGMNKAEDKEKPHANKPKTYLEAS